jgi:hypothetical protein
MKYTVASYNHESYSEEEYGDYIANMEYAPIKGKQFYIDGRNLNWQGRDGYLVANTIIEVAEKILMHDGRCTTEVWKGEERNTLEATTWHHDCPTGSHFTIMTLHKAKKKGLI